VAATIHVRIAAQHGPTSSAAQLLSLCLEGLEENAATNTGVKKMFGVISGLMRRLGVVLPHREGSIPAEMSRSTSSNRRNTDLDILARSTSGVVTSPLVGLPGDMAWNGVTGIDGECAAATTRYGD
jgi:hypothetical protein